MNARSFTRTASQALAVLLTAALLVALGPGAAPAAALQEPATATPTPMPLPESSPTPTETATATATATETSTLTPSATLTETPTATPTETPSPTPELTPSPTTEGLGPDAIDEGGLATLGLATLTDISAGLTGVQYSSLAWGDYDSDGDLDLALSGYTGSSRVTRLYRNNGDGTFSDAAAGLQGVSSSSLAWGDYDSDGDPDLTLSGYTGSARLTRLYRNNGNGTFTDAAAGLPGLRYSSLAWGDYDNDGDLDLALSGYTGSAGLSWVYRNNGDGTFTDANAGLPGVYQSSMAWGDYDNDGDLDLLLAGYTGSSRISRIYRNDGAPANTAPGAPAGLSATAGESSLALSWAAASDAETPTSALSYNLRIGTTPGGSDVLSPMAAASGWRRLPGLGNANLGLTATLSLPNPAPGSTYYWSVQAVDSAWAGGPFAGEASLTIEPVQAAFSATPLAGAAPLQVAFTNTSTGAWASSLWDFGDTITSTLTSPTHTYAAPGVYTVTLTVSGLGGSDAEVKARYVDAYPAVADPGACDTDLAIQNLGAANAFARVSFTTAGEAGTAWDGYLDALTPRATRWLLASQLGGPAAGAWAGAGDVAASQPVAALVEMRWDNAATGQQAAATYSGVDAPATAAYLPYLSTAPGQRSRLTVQNAGDAEATVSIRFYDRAGTLGGTKVVTVAAASEITLSLEQLPEADFSATGGLGSAAISAGQPIAAVASVHWPNASDAYASVDAGATTLLAPGAQRQELGDGRWDCSELIVQNLAADAASVHIEFTAADGTVSHSFDDSIPAHDAASYSTRDATALGADWQGTIKVTSTGGQALAGVSVTWLPSAGVADSLASNAARSPTADALAFPAVYRKLAGAGDDRWSALLVHNASATAGTLTVEFYDASGTRVGGAYQVAVAAGGLARLSLKDGLDLPLGALEALGTDFTGSVWITPSAGMEIVGVAQTVWPGEGRAAAYAGFAAP